MESLGTNKKKEALSSWVLHFTVAFFLAFSGKNLRLVFEVHVNKKNPYKF